MTTSSSPVPDPAHDPAHDPAPPPAGAASAARPARVPRPGVEWEYRTITMPRGTSRSQARQLLTDHAEYGRWELSRVRLYVGGQREVQLRRKTMRVERSA